MQGMRKNFIGKGNDAFVCAQCNSSVEPLTSGSYRNHCPRCLFSKHVDVVPGDRLASCGGLMEPVNVEYASKKGWMVMHRCMACGFARPNKAALRDVQPDDFSRIIALASSQ